MGMGSEWSHRMQIGRAPAKRMRLTYSSMLFRDRSALAGMIGTSPQSISRNSSNRLMSKSPRYGRYWSETKRIILGARLDPERYTVAWSKGTPRKTAFAPSFWIACVSHGTQGDFRNVPGPL